VDPHTVGAIAAAQLEEIADQLRESGRHHEHEVAAAHARLATNPLLIDAWRRRMAAGEGALTALALAVDDAAADDPEPGNDAARFGAAGLRAVGARMARIVTGEDLALPDQPSIIAADQLSPATVANLPPALVLGIALEHGWGAEEVSTLARSLRVPCVVGVAGLLAEVDAALAAAQASGGGVPEIAVDGVAGLVFTQPTGADLAGMRERRSDAIRAGAIAAGVRDRPAQTKDGHRIRLVAEIGGPADVARALEARAEGVGLFRAESLFMDHRTTPTEDEQVDAYSPVFEAFGADRPVVVRLAGMGADDGPHLRPAEETNPELGVRGIRLAGRDGSAYRTQIRAISRAAAMHGVAPHVMAAMMTTLADVDLLNKLIQEAQESLAADGIAAASRVVPGVMVQVPSAAFLTREFSPRVDFFCVEANTLTQYLLAADRANPALAHLQDPLHPVVLRAIRMVSGAAGAAAKPVTVAGDMAGDPAGALVLVGLGVDELAMDPDAMDGIRYHLAGVTYEKLQHLAARALESHDAAEVRALADDLVEWRPRMTPPARPAG